jgi:hypothetical protein
LEEGNHGEHGDARETGEQDAGPELGDAIVVHRGEQDGAEPLGRAEPLADDCPDQRKAGAQTNGCEDGGQRGGQLQLPQDGEAAGVPVGYLRS